MCGDAWGEEVRARSVHGEEDEFLGFAVEGLSVERHFAKSDVGGQIVRMVIEDVFPGLGPFFARFEKLIFESGHLGVGLLSAWSMDGRSVLLT